MVGTEDKVLSFEVSSLPENVFKNNTEIPNILSTIKQMIFGLFNFYFSTLELKN